MRYTPINWTDAKKTAANFNHMDKQIYKMSSVFGDGENIPETINKKSRQLMSNDFQKAAFAKGGERYGMKVEDTFIPFHSSGIDLIWENKTPFGTDNPFFIGNKLTHKEINSNEFIGEVQIKDFMFVIDEELTYSENFDSIVTGNVNIQADKITLLAPGLFKESMHDITTGRYHVPKFKVYYIGRPVKIN